MSKKIKFWLKETISKGYSFDKDELIDKFEKIKHNNPTDDELYDFFQDKFDLEDLKELDSFEVLGEQTVEEEDIKDIDCRMAFDE